MDDENNVLFVRGNNTSLTSESVDDVWDDSALIKAYDKAVNMAKDEVFRRMEMEIECPQQKSSKLDNPKKANRRQKLRQKWTVGAPCKAIYSADGEIYEAIVTKVHENTETCIVKFVGYGNSEKVEISGLLESGGPQSQIAQQRESNASILLNDSQGNVREFPNMGNRSPDCARANGIEAEEQNMDYESEKPKIPNNVFDPRVSFNSSYGMMPPPPPVPPQLMAKLPDNDADALSSMLMSWYISGFHTGYYHGIKQARNVEERRKK